jgi:hypothetical protein
MSKKLKTNLQTDVPNIRYVGKRQLLNKKTLKMETVAKEVPAFIIDGADKIKLPKGIEKGIYMNPDTVARLFALRPDDFKTPILKARTRTAKPPVKSKSESKVEVTK